MVIDFGDLDCQVFVIFDLLVICFEECGILFEFVLMKCDDNGILLDLFDDVFMVIILVNVNNLVGNIWVVSIGVIGIYGVIFIMVFFLIVVGDVMIIFSDQVDLNCVGSLMVILLEICLDVCDIIFVQVVNVECSDNGMFLDLSDDIFIFEVIVIGVNILVIWMDNLGNIGIYGVLVFYGLFSIVVNLIVILDIIDVVDGICIVQVVVVVFLICFDVCDINVIIVQGLYCNDNGILFNLNDDVYFIDV